MIRFSKNKLYTSLVIFISILILSFAIPTFRPAAFFILKIPLKLGTLIEQEINAFVFYHRNYVENRRIRKDNDNLRSQLNMLNELYLENNRLRDILGFKQSSSFKLLAARVIGRDPGNWSSVVVIDKGKNSQVKENQLVITSLGVAGKITEVDFNTSKVMLINDVHINIPVIAQRSRYDGLVTGTLQKNLVMKFLSYDADLSIGDAIMTSGLDDFYPKGILIGKIISFTRDSTGLSRYAVIEPTVNVYRIEEVLVVLK